MSVKLHLLLMLALHEIVAGLNYYVISDDDGLGRRFDGIGGISGGSATSKLLVNYPEKLRDEILDFLFKPNFGASLHILKVEIGGDSQASGGTESSHMHEVWDENYFRGYEWWIMKEAKKRNPGIKLYGLPWTFPGFLGDTSGTPYRDHNATASYIIKWIVGAKRYHNLDINYIGIWNENKYNIDYVMTLKRELVRNNLSNVSMVVADDNGWAVSDDVLKHPQFAGAVDIIGVHYPGTKTTKSALKTGKVLWSSEDYSTFNNNVGAGCWARILNQNYVTGHMTSTISWNLISSYYPALPSWNRQGLMTANQPWSGHYVVESPIWMSAHTTQFTEIGWHYLEHGSGVDMLDGGGSFVTLTSPDRKQFTIVIETMSHDHSICIRPPLPPYSVKTQTAVFHLTGNLSGIQYWNVWRSQLHFDGTPSVLFKKSKQVRTWRGIFNVTVQPDEVITLTTLSTGRKGKYDLSPPSKLFPLPYKDDFEGYPEYSEMFNFAGQNGVFEVRQTNDPTHGKVNRQVVLHDPVYWCRNSRGPTFNLGGNSDWRNISVQVDVFVPSVNGSNSVYVAARAGPGGCDIPHSAGIFFAVFPSNNSFAVATDIMFKDILVNGTVKTETIAVNKWFTLKLSVQDHNAAGFINAVQQFSTKLTKKSPAHGFAAYGTLTYGYSDFDNLYISDSQS